MNAQYVSTVLVLSDLALHCAIATHGKRLIDQLNDGESDYVDAREARVFRRQEGEPVVIPGELLVAKKQIHMALPVDRKPGADKLFFATIDRQRYKVVATTSTAVIRGSVQAKIAKDPRSFLTVDAGLFFAITGTTVQHSAIAEKLESPVVIVRKACVSSLAFIA